MRSVIHERWRYVLPVVCAVWTAGWAWGDTAAVAVLVPVVLVGTYVGVRRALPGALIVLVAHAGVHVLGLPPDTPAVLLGGITVTFLLGREERALRGLLVVGAYVAVIPMSGMPLAGLVIGMIFQLAAWGLGFAVQRVDRAAKDAHERSAALQSANPQRQIEEIVAAERRRMELDVLETLRQSVAAIREVAHSTGGRVDARALRTVRALAQATIADLRTLLVSLRTPAAPTDAGLDTHASRRRVWRQDIVLTLGVIVLGAFDAVVVGKVFPSAPTLAWAALACVLVLPWRRTAPEWACVAAAVPIVLAYVLDVDLIVGLAALVTFSVLTWSAVATSQRKAWAACAALFLAVVLAPTHTATVYPMVTGSIFGFTAIASYAWHRRVGERDEATLMATAYESAVWARVEPVLADVRRALARELHDAVSGMVGVVAVHAEAAAALAVRDPARAQQSMDVVLDASSRAGVELERLRRVLHDAVPEGPTPWGRVHADAKALGLRVEARIDTTVTDLGAATTAYHVVAEALANAAKYAAGARVTVRIRRIKDDLCVTVVDDGGRDAPHVAAGTGFGLLSQAERVERLGGRLWAAPTGEGFAVRARIPLPPRTADPYSEVRPIEAVTGQEAGA